MLMRPGTPFRVHLALFSVAFLFSLNYLMGKIALRQLDPRALAFVRVSGAAILLSLIPERGPLAPLSSIDRRDIALFAVLGVVLNQIFFLGGLSLTSAHEAAILITTIPIFTLAAAAAFRFEAVSRMKLIGIVVAGAGALTVISTRTVQKDHGSLAGDLLILCNCLCYGLYLVRSRTMMLRLSALRVVRTMFLFAVPLMLPFVADALIRQQWRGLATATWLAVAGIIAGPTVCAYMLNAWALGKAESSAVAAYTYVQPFVATILAVAFLGERVNGVVVVAGILIFAGVFLSSGGWKRAVVTA